jgi:hypothetical protein
MAHCKRNRSVRKVGHGRGVPLRFARAIAKKYSLTHIVILSGDEKQRRSRVIYWATNDMRATQLAAFCAKLAEGLGRSTIYDWDCSQVRKLKERIKELERFAACIFESEFPDPREAARIVLRLPEDM